MTKNIKILLNEIVKILTQLTKNPTYIDKIYYINLEHRIDRKEHIENQIKKYIDPELSITKRFNAIENKNGHIGCSKSHLGIIKECIQNNYNNVLIFEDDFEFIIDKFEFKDYLDRFFTKYTNYDILLLGVNGPSFANKSDFFKVTNSQTTSGYIINNRVFKQFRDICKESINGLENKKSYNIYCIDQLWKKIQRNGNVYTFPKRVGRQRVDYSDICKKRIDYKL